jgi:hypothetical protein
MSTSKITQSMRLDFFERLFCGIVSPRMQLVMIRAIEKVYRTAVKNWLKSCEEIMWFSYATPDGAPILPLQ